MTDYREMLRRIRTFPSLIKFLQEELDWPIISGDFEELTFEYTPEELGIDTANAAKIQEIKRLRPLSVNQPWGIFFVKFEPKRLPVVALRRILRQVVIKKRASANSAELASWQADDLLFISNYGEGDERQISFAHFAQPGQKNDLLTLKVLGWDTLDTGLHLDHVADVLVGRLAWPDDEEDVESWRKTWRSVFTLGHREVITTSRDLAVRLAELARAIRDQIKDVLPSETKDGPLTKIMKAFQEALVHDLDPDSFADMYAQTIAYGLLSARVENPRATTTDDFSAQLPVTNPFLKELMETFLHVGGSQGKARSSPGIDFDELGVSEVVDLLYNPKTNMEAILRDFGDRKPEEDPVIHFYELFLKEYDAHKKMQRGVFYTPRPVVSYIVRSVDELLRTEFGLPDGLADTATWGDMAKRHAGLKIPQGMKPGDAFVQILDPATGTGTFLVEAIDLIHKTMTGKWKAQGHGAKEIGRLWNDYVPQHLLPRLYGYELLMAPYAIAHMKLGLKLYETGYRFGSEERVRVYLTNALEPAQDFSGKLAFMIPALAHEAQAVNAIKRHQRFTVVIGNPPYSYMSANLNEVCRALIEPFRYVDGQRIVERGALVFERALQDDYVKFFALAFRLLQESGSGFVSMISNSAYLNSPHHRGMRCAIKHDFSRFRTIDLHGDIKSGTAEDQNVFDIRTGVAVALAEKLPSRQVFRCAVSDLKGPRSVKETALNGSTISSDCKDYFTPEPPQYLFNEATGESGEYGGWPSVADIFPLTSVGIKTNRDDFVIGFADAEIERRIRVLIDPKKTTKEVKEELAIKDNAQWTVEDGRRDCRTTYTAANYRPLDYRPFDRRRIYYHSSIVFNPRPAVMVNLLSPGNLALLTNRRIRTDSHAHFFVSDKLCMAELLSSADNCNVYPLWLIEQKLLHGHARRPNLNPAFLKTFSDRLNLPLEGPYGLPKGLTPEDIFHYAYAVFHSPGYRSRYAEFLKMDFPRLLLTSSMELFRSLAQLGGELVALHLVEAPVQQALSVRYDQPAKAWRYEVTPGHRLPVALTFTGPAAPVVDKVGWSDDTVWLDATATKKGQPATPGTIGFRGVPAAVWNFHIGGYQVCQKWLKDRKGRTLSADDLTQYQRIVIALHETIRLMAEIDEVIDQHGGWPDAFQVKGKA